MKEKSGLTIEIIAVGSEFLTPYYQDTNSLYLTSQLNDLGLKVSYKSIVGDEYNSLLSCFRNALDRSDMIFVIGGLGPTTDDITRETFAKALGREMEFKNEIFKDIKKRFQKRKIDMAPSNKRQAFIIKGSEVIENKAGSAPGLWIDNTKNIIVLLPGPPVEMKAVFESQVLPRIKKYKAGFRIHKTLKMTGITESRTESLISDLYPDSPGINMTLLAYPGQIEIHLSSHSPVSLEKSSEKVNPILEKIKKRLEKYIFSENGEELEEVIGRLLSENRKTVSTAESCTGGLLGHRITNVPGSSQYYLQGFQVYSNEAKVKLLGIDKAVIEKKGAVSSEVAKRMAEEVRRKSKSDFGLAITGIAGPSGGTSDKPVGLVFTALSWDNGVKVEKNHFLGNRSTIKFRSTQKAMNMLRRYILFQEKD